MAPKPTPGQVDAYLGHVRALIKTAQSYPDGDEGEHVIVTELFPGFVAAVEAIRKEIALWKRDASNSHAASVWCAEKIEDLIEENLLGGGERRV
jgi:hypothetical protein